ncbi:unnamed protein product [Vitrella brassicaformis CCMP3155]|uniref:C3H1-type domain-containing protein n=1 Tax=Vitrella brassicaformis (strain CCMP3155) TaxID=1169540 RepID=A0A0G4F8H5_VITBC|nr:unnamed protein product [Vitrella brassicaformis CCMP3155]|eukprot:CEM09010.1 unnamed protein product [Vitrella brassicaformis CCMP3155]
MLCAAPCFSNLTPSSPLSRRRSSCHGCCLRKPSSGWCGWAAFKRHDDAGDEEEDIDAMWEEAKKDDSVALPHPPVSHHPYVATAPYGQPPPPPYPGLYAHNGWAPSSLAMPPHMPHTVRYAAGVIVQMSGQERQPLFRTDMCKYHLQGYCGHGQHCRFAHVADQLVKRGRGGNNPGSSKKAKKERQRRNRRARGARDAAAVTNDGEVDDDVCVSECDEVMPCLESGQWTVACE